MHAPDVEADRALQNSAEEKKGTGLKTVGRPERRRPARDDDVRGVHRVNLIRGGVDHVPIVVRGAKLTPDVLRPEKQGEIWLIPDGVVVDHAVVPLGDFAGK